MLWLTKRLGRRETVCDNHSIFAMEIPEGLEPPTS
jgi:hypothetical protein